ncbi:Gfo/Idh/MocA family oxidoreductase [Paenibacillus sp. GD4]|uniref:Gfo/Idh/MocA family protein n=1 Tax=Paenibacillus sp. GD4 TaxID=3068890 RepID=UPI0027968B18|nr:Gfo/Idh/MocA family oxidoreductase [Paenibacillus sp. GD4]MDQ1911901.1 Gfo/Idh/MocA family oxidoreductase [Paenibacillus sp. GD4]
MGKPASFSILGGAGFRAQYYLRIAQALPDRFQVSGMVVRDEAKGKALEQQWKVNTYRTLEELLSKERPDFVVESVSLSARGGYLLQLSNLGIPVLAETPPAADLQGLTTLYEKLTSMRARVQVAEQYHLHPVNQARAAVIKQGRLGSITEATVSVSHFYHGVSLIRRMLGVGFEEVAIRGMRFHTEWMAGPNRSGPPKEEKRIPAQRDLAWLDFGDKLGIYDFTKDQHRSWIRSNHLSVRGERGEIFDNRLTVMKDYRTPLHLDMKRINKGELENQEGYFLQGYMAGEQWAYENPFAPARLYDDELAIAHCLEKMADYAAGGPEFYSLSEASHDQYLGLLIEQAIQTGETVRSVPQPWTTE